MFFTTLNVVLVGLLIGTVSFVTGFLLGKRCMCALLKDYVDSFEDDDETEEEETVDEDDSEPWDNDPDWWKHNKK